MNNGCTIGRNPPREQKHTPGPWKHNELPANDKLGLGDYLPCAVWTDEGTPRFIATTEPCVESWSMDKYEAAANCRLIAAAPELLAACQKILPLLVEFCNLYPATSDIVGVPRACALADARAAIAKAQG